MVVRLGDDRVTRAPVRQVTLRSAGSACSAGQLAGQASPAGSSPRGRIGVIKGDERVKKHSSPSKKDLEDLEAALQRYLPSEKAKSGRLNVLTKLPGMKSVWRRRHRNHRCCPPKTRTD